MKSACILLVLAVLTACQRTPTEPSPATAPATSQPVAPTPERVAFRPQFADDAAGIAVLPVADFELHHDFARGYFGSDEWKAFAGPDSSGKPLVALVLQDSNDVTAAEMRIGVSQQASALADCLRPADSAETVQTDEVRIDGQAFQHFQTGDAGMSHYANVDAYRAVRNGHCIAIDLWLVGTRPEVYDPPRQPPFDAATAKAKLQEALAAVRITR